MENDIYGSDEVKMAESMVRSRIDPVVKREAQKVLRSLGISLSEGIRLFLVQVITEKALPFKAKIPNKRTLAAMEAASRGKVEPTHLEALKKCWKRAECGK
jgi:DNA-damage-inducible protein J